MAAPETERLETEMEADDITPAPDGDEDTDDTVSSSDDECGDDEAGEADAEIAALESEVIHNIYIYDPHVKLIKLLKKAGELDQLRSARERMNTVFPLSEELWLDWLRDEMPLVFEPSGRLKVDKLFQRAVKDYQSVDIWLEYVQYSIGGMGQPDGIHTIRKVFESAITAVGLHPSQGATIWEAYREFEHAVLAGLMPKPGSVVTKEQEEAFSTQHQRVLSLFKRQLAVPLLDMNETYSEFSDWLGEDVDQATKTSYEKALKKLEKLRPLEGNLLAAEPPKSAEYQAYITHELSEGDPVRIQCIFERTIKENCLLPDIWCQYTKYLDTKLRVRPLTLAVYDRAVKNCSWSSSLWQGYLIALERYQEDGDKMQETFDQAFRSLSASAADSLLMWMCYCDYAKRKIKWENDHSKELDYLRAAIQRGIHVLLEYFGIEGDPTGSLLRYWAFIEAKFCRNMQKCRELWTEVMTQGHGNEAQMWLDYYRVERAYGDHKHCSKLLQRALNSVTDWPENIAEAYINYQREEGSLEDYEVAVSKCDAQLQRINERRGKASEKEAFAENQRKQAISEKRAGKKQQKNQPPKGSLEHAKNLSDSKQKVNIHKRKFDGGDAADVHTEEFKVPAPKESRDKRPPPSGFKVPPPPGYKAPSEPPTKRLKPDEAQPSREPVVHDPSKNDRTVFISNIAFSLEEEKITQIFQECGEISELRIVKTFMGKSKGYGYLEFKDELAVDAALKLDRLQVDGRPMFVSRCEEKSSRQPQFKFATNMEKNKLFIRGLPFKCTKEDLEKVFCEHGKLKEVRLVTYRNGTSKGLAFVEYEKEAEAAQAVFKTDGMKIGEHIISVAISNPPERKMQLSRREESSYMPSLGGGKKETKDRGKVRTQVSLVPRALHRRQPGNKPSTSSSESNNKIDANEQTDKPDIKMSNADFRNMLLKK